MRIIRRPNTSPNAIFRNNYEDFKYYLAHLECKEPREGLVPDSTFFCFDEKKKSYGRSSEYPSMISMITLPKVRRNISAMG